MGDLILLKGQQRGGKYISRRPVRDPKTGKMTWEYKYAEPSGAVAPPVLADAPERPKVDLSKLLSAMDKAGVKPLNRVTLAKKEEKKEKEKDTGVVPKKTDPFADMRDAWRIANIDGHQTVHHADAIPRSEMAHDENYALWQRIGGSWIREHTLSGLHVLKAEAYWEGIKKRSGTDKPFAFFQSAVNPNGAAVEEKPDELEMVQELAGEEESETMKTYLALKAKLVKLTPGDVVSMAGDDDKEHHRTVLSVGEAGIVLGPPPGKAVGQGILRDRGEPDENNARVGGVQFQLSASGTPFRLKTMDAASKEKFSKDKSGMIEMEQFKVGENRPPNFLGLRKDALQWDYNEPLREAVPEGMTDITKMSFAQFLEHTGFWKTLEDMGQGDGWSYRFFTGQIRDERRYDAMSMRQKRPFGRIAKELTSWWTDLRDDERNRFWEEFVDEDHQYIVGKLTDPRHEHKDLEIPKGMEKLAASKDPKGVSYDFHEFQKKAINFASEHAERCMWAMEMGLGKTLAAQGLYHKLKARGDVKQMLVTAPKSAQGSWEDHFKDFSDAKCVTTSRMGMKQKFEAYEKFARGEIDVLVVTPETLQKKYDTKAFRNEKGKMLEDREIADTLRTAEAGYEVQVKQSDGTATTFEARAGTTGVLWYQTEPRALTNAITPEQITTLFREAERNYQQALDAPEYQRPRNLTGATIGYMGSRSHVAALKKITQNGGKDILRVMDEVHKFKNPAGAGSKGAWQVMTDPEGRVVGMTGTPKPNKIDDFYHIASVISPGGLGDSVLDFGRQYGYMDGSSILGMRPEMLGNLYQQSAGFVFARTVADPDVKIVLPPRKDLAPQIPPDKVQEDLLERIKKYMDLKAQARSEKGESSGTTQGMIDDAMSDDNPDPLDRCAARVAPSSYNTALLRFAQLAIDPTLLEQTFVESGEFEKSLKDDMPDYESPKLKACVDATIEHLTNNPERGAVLFCEFEGGVQAALRALERRGFDRKLIGLYTGSTTMPQRRKAEKNLNDGTIKILIGNTGALETGANLQKRANFVVHLNTSWKPDRLSQSTARVYRQGQRFPVTVFRPTGSPVEELIEGVLSRKLMESAQVQGRSMDADDAISSSVRKHGKQKIDRDGIAAVLGLDASVFAASGEADDSDAADQLKFDTDTAKEQERIKAALEKE